jgi:S1-C subfamily serine protease
MVGTVLGSQIADELDDPPGRASELPVNIAEPREDAGVLDVAAVAEYIAPSVVTISADVGPGTSVGTGVIISEDGEILTNSHVVENADRVRVRLAGETEPREVTVLASDVGNDLALLRMSGDGFAAATFADPGSTRIGDEVLAMGFALGLDGDPSVTLGIVSALDRSIGDGQVFLDGLIQTDAAISSGNSGGPLVNAAGEVVGINTAVARDTATTAATNVGFAISAREALPVIEALREQANSGDSTQRERAFLGVQLEERQDGGQGVVVVDVTAGTPADAVGIETGDVIVAVDGTAMEGSAALIAAIGDHDPGDEVTVTVVRDGEPIELGVALTNRPDQD